MPNVSGGGAPAVVSASPSARRRSGEGRVPVRVGVPPAERRILRRGRAGGISRPRGGDAHAGAEVRSGETPKPAGGTPTLPEAHAPSERVIISERW
jgi:hypothetical protein